MGSAIEAGTVVGLCCMWYAVSSGSNVVGKLVLNEFPYPVTVTMVQLLSVAAYSVPILALFKVRPLPPFPSRYYLRTLLPLALAKFFTTVFSQVSIWKVPVSYAHTVKATTPLWTVTLARILFGERQTAAVHASLAIIIAGVIIASATELQFEIIGLGAALLSAMLISLQHLFSKRIMKETSIHPLRLLEILSRLALALFIPFWILWDGPSMFHGIDRPINGWTRTGVLLVLDGALAYVQAVLAFSVLWRVTPLTYAVASAAKRIVVVLASVLVLRNPVSGANATGMTIAALGVLAYNRAKLQNKPKPLLPV